MNGIYGFIQLKTPRRGKSSYNKIYTIKNYLDFKVLDDAKQNYQNGMFFVMSVSFLIGKIRK